MPLGRRGDVGWWSPDPRGVLPLPGLRVSRSLRRSARRFEIRVDTAFEQVIAACADPRRPDGWITGDVLSAYVRLHELGWAHSVEAWDGDDGELVGGLYGVAIGGLFAGESMFHRRTDASKVALLGLVELLAEGGGLGRVLDVQWVTPHLASLGAEEVPRWRYLEMVRRAVKLPLPPAFRPPPPS
jgi:leucyl/phenylalanyl-tRNA--protein transferase